MSENSVSKKAKGCSLTKDNGIKRRSLLLSTTSLVALSGVVGAVPSAQAQQAEEILPKPEPPGTRSVKRRWPDRSSSASFRPIPN